MTLPWFLNPWAEVRRLHRETCKLGLINQGLCFHNRAVEKQIQTLKDNFQQARKTCLLLSSENAELRRRIVKQEMELNSWGQRYATQCSINAMVEQENARLKGDPSPLSRTVDSRESSAENCGFLPKNLSDDSHEFRCYCGNCFGKPVKMWGGK